MEPHLILHCCRCGAAYHQGVPVRTSCGQESCIRRRPGARGGVLQIVVVVERAGESGVEMVLAARQDARDVSWCLEYVWRGVRGGACGA